MKRLIVPTDFSAESRQAFGPAAETARTRGWGIALVHVVQEPMVLTGADPGTGVAIPQLTLRELSAAAVARLEHDRAAFGELDVETRVLVGISVARSLCELAAEIDAAGIAIASHGRSGLVRLVLGSTTERVVRQATVPVTCYPVS